MLAYTLRKDKKRKDAEITEKMAIKSRKRDWKTRFPRTRATPIIEVFKKLRPGEPVTLEGSQEVFRKHDL